MKKNFKLVLALVLALSLFASMTAALAVAYTGSDGDGATITISNAAKGETYTVVKLFDATVGAASEYPIAYQGTIPSSLSTYFEKDATTGAITATAAAKNGDELTSAAQTALKAWAEAEVDKDPHETTILSATAEGGALEFTNLPYGYYVVLTTQGAGSVTVNSTRPNANVVDKNTTTPTLDKKVKNANNEWVELTDANIGQNVQFKVDFMTATWKTPKNGSAQKQVKEYILGDDFNTNKFDLVSIDSVTVGTMDNEGNFTALDNGTLTVANVATGGNAFPITVPWASESQGVWTSFYPNGAYVRVLYTAKLKDNCDVDYKDANVNTATLNWKFIDDSQDEDHLEDTASVDTYAIGLKKFDKSGNGLNGATFQFPFYVKAEKDTNGNYVYAGTEPGEGLINQITTPDDGQITVIGVKAGTYSITETEAPDGYNKLNGPISVTAVKISTTTTVTSTTKKWKIDSQGRVYDYSETVENATETTYTNNTVAATVVGAINLKGAELPHTGGIGTTLFYIGGSVLVLAAAILLITKRRMGNND